MLEAKFAKAGSSDWIHHFGGSMLVLSVLKVSSIQRHCDVGLCLTTFNLFKHYTTG